MQINDGRVISNFIVQALQGKDITIYGDGSQTRSFCYVDDLIDVIIKFMDSPDEFKGPLNIGNPSEYSISEIADLIIKLTQSKSKIVYLKLPKDDPRQRKPDISQALKNLDWSPKVDINDGLKFTIDYFKSILKNK